MADYPCDFHLARYSGPSTRCFLNLYQEDKVSSFRASVCGDCLAEVVQGWLARALVKTEAGYWDPCPDNLALEDTWQTRQRPQEGHPSRFRS